MNQTQIDAYRYIEKRTKKIGKLVSEVAKVNRSLAVAETSFSKRYEQAAGVYTRFDRRVCPAHLVGTHEGNKWFDSKENRRLELLQKMAVVRV